MDDNTMDRKKAEIVARVWSSSDFKRQFAANPKEVIAAEFAVDLPADINVKVLFDTPDTQHLVIVPPGFLPADGEPTPETAIISRTWTEPAFKSALLADPRAALDDHFQFKLPAKPALKVVEQTDDTFYIVIPERPEELTDEALDQVAGGQAYVLNDKWMQQFKDFNKVPVLGTAVGVAWLATGTIAEGAAQAGVGIAKGAKAVANAVSSIFHRRW